MDDKVAQLILDELFSSLEVLETQTAAVLQFLKEKASASDEQLAPFLEQAGKASSTKRRAARVRIDYLISGIADPPQKVVERDVAKGEKKPPEPTAGKPKEKAHEKDGEEQSDQRKKTQDETEAKTEVNSKGEERAKEHAAAGAGRDESEQGKRTAGSAVDNEKKNKPTQPDATDQKTGEKKMKRSPAKSQRRNRQPASRKGFSSRGFLLGPWVDRIVRRFCDGSSAACILGLPQLFRGY
jgi:hypothetical protein